MEGYPTPLQQLVPPVPWYPLSRQLQCACLWPLAAHQHTGTATAMADIKPAHSTLVSLGCAQQHQATAVPSPQRRSITRPRCIAGSPCHQCNSAAAVQGQALEDPLDNEEHLQEQLESLPYLCRFQSEKMSSYFCSAFDARLQRYTAISQGSPPSSNIELQVRPLPSTSTRTRQVPLHQCLSINASPECPRQNALAHQNALAWPVPMPHSAFSCAQCAVLCTHPLRLAPRYPCKPSSYLSRHASVSCTYFLV